MKLATLKNGTRDGRLVVVSRDLARAVDASAIAPTMQFALEHWDDVETRLQALSRAGLLDSVRGPRGGYRLGRPRRDIRLSEIVDVAVAGGASEASDGADGPIGALQSDVIDPLWAEIDAAARAQLGALTLEDLLKRAAAAGLRRPTAEPISFAI